MAGIELLTIGETFQDLIFVGLPQLPRAGEEVKTARFVDTVGGGAAITAIAAARLGMRVATITAASAAAERRLRRERVAVTNLRRSNEPHAVTVALSTRRDRGFATFTGVNARLQPRLARSVATRAAAHVHFAFTPDRCAPWTRIVRRMRAEGVTTSWDFGWDPSLPRRAGFGALMRAVDFVFMNEPEFAMYARRLVTPDSIAIVKLGARGSRWVAADATLHAAATRVRAVDTTGAGDAFNAGFLYGFLRGGSPRACLEMGNYVGARSTKAAGGIDALPGRPARSAFVRARPARRSGNEPARP